MDTATLKPLRPFRDKLFWLLGARVAHYLSVAPRQFVDAFPLAEPDCVLVDQVLPNAQRNLWPGGFVNLRVKLRTVQGGIVVPAPAVQRGPQGSFVYAVKDDQTIDMRPVTVASIEGEQALIESGLAAGETVVVDGVGKLQSGAKVIVQTREAQDKPQ